MAGRALPSFCLALFLAAGSTAARADNEGIAVGEPSPTQQQQAETPAPLPKLLGFGKGEDGTHVFLFSRQGQAPVVFIGKPGDLQELEVLGIERGKGKFMVDTLEMGDLVFNTTERSVIIPGEVGFNSKKPTQVLKGKPDQAAFVEAMARMGYARRAPTAVQSAAQGLVKVVARSRELAAANGNKRLGFFQQSATSRAKIRAKSSVRRPVARVRPGARSGQSVRTTARVKAH
jgi:hypothetical protein